ncbi:MAG: DUF1573 domain-containing protein [Bacteroidota bacterium]
MFNSLKALALVALVGLFAVSCASDASDAKDEARAEITTAPETATTPATPAATTPEAPKGPTTTMTFEESTFDFGTVESGEKVRHTYKFTNTGEEPLVISNAKGSCGCTVPKWPQEPIAPGAEGEIEVEFDSKNKSGRQTKTVTITANTDGGTERLTITGEVLKDPNAPAPGAAPSNVQIVQ